MTSSCFLRTTVVALAIAGAACSSSTSLPGGSGGALGSGGATSSGGQPGTGGSTSSGGQPGAGGSTSSGGQPGAGGSTSLGGQPGTGGGTRSGGRPANGRSGGPPGAGGSASLGGKPVTGGATSSGGQPGTGGASGTGGSTGSGGSSAAGGSGPGAGGSGTTGDAGVYVGTKTPGTAQTGDITVDPTKTHQVVDGFGLADVWQGSSSTAMQTALWDPVNGIGLNLLRIGIESVSGTSVLMGNAGTADGKACVKFSGSDCKVWAAPWSPPAAMKDNNNVNGGESNDTLKTASYDAWATLLAAFPAYYKQQSGVDLFAVSAQNEPDWNATYEACIYNKTQMVTFINTLGPKLAALTPPVKVLAAEPDNWGNCWGGDAFGTAILADATASSYVGIIATHDYGTASAGTVARPAPPANNTKHIWETECTPGDTGPITIATMVRATCARSACPPCPASMAGRSTSPR